MRIPGLASLVAVVSLAATSLPAQWVTFQDQTATRLNAPAALGTNDLQEKDYAWADLDQDGDTDLVVVRKEPASSAGHFPNVLLMNVVCAASMISRRPSTAVIAYPFPSALPRIVSDAPAL